MILIVGLGNPGKKFEKTRHNLGFRILNEFAKDFKFPDFRLEKKFLAKISQGEMEGKKIILAKPQTFMNNSGKSVELLTKPYLPASRLGSRPWQAGTPFPNNLIIVHDDLDLPLGKIKIVKNRGSGGHKGVQTIIDELGTKNFVRFRIGIKSKNKEQKTKNNIENFVLERFSKNEERVLKKVIKKTCQAIEVAIKEGVEKAMSEFNC